MGHREADLLGRKEGSYTGQTPAGASLNSQSPEEAASLEGHTKLPVQTVAVPCASTKSVFQRGHSAQELRTESTSSRHLTPSVFILSNTGSERAHKSAPMLFGFILEKEGLSQNDAWLKGLELGKTAHAISGVHWV